MTDTADPETTAQPTRRSFLKGLGTAAAAGGLISAPGLQVANAHSTDANGLAASSLARAPAR